MVIPKWILFRINSSKLTLSSKVEKIFLNSEILKVERSCKYLESASLHYSSKLKEVLLFEDLVKFNNYIDEVVTKLKCKMIKDNSKKLNNLILRKFGTLARYNVFNYSDRQLTEQEYFALSLGINFSLPPKHVDKELVFFRILIF